MNQQIEKLIDQCQWETYGVNDELLESGFAAEKFAELIVKECGVALSPMLRDMVSRGQAYELIKQHFGVEEYSAQPDQEADAFIAAEDKKVASRYGYFPKLHPSEWKDK